MASQDYWNTVATATGLLSAKVFGLHVLTTRTRIMTGQFKTPEDNTIGKLPLLPAIFKVALCCFGPTFKDPSRLTGCAGNSVENEPYMLLLAVVMGLARTPPENAGKLLMAYVALRYVHMLTYLAGVQPWRGSLVHCRAGFVDLLRRQAAGAVNLTSQHKPDLPPLPIPLLTVPFSIPLRFTGTPWRLRRVECDCTTAHTNRRVAECQGLWP
eukprot:Sspe_Gene.50940::Locus_28293_Transcript_1_1_Confidence_1.000_Length_704::g.50940::m.50940/K00799/GST, gst; glutathione S-transferase